MSKSPEEIAIEMGEGIAESLVEDIGFIPIYALPLWKKPKRLSLNRLELTYFLLQTSFWGANAIDRKKYADLRGM